MGQLTVTHPTNAKSSLQSLKREERTGVSFPRFFTAKLEANKTPYDLITWELRTATIGSDFISASIVTPKPLPRG